MEYGACGDRPGSGPEAGALFVDLVEASASQRLKVFDRRHQHAGTMAEDFQKGDTTSRSELETAFESALSEPQMSPYGQCFHREMDWDTPHGNGLFHRTRGFLVPGDGG